jgi:diguanylate cyclase
MPKMASNAGVRRALNRKQLLLFYQPIHELVSRRIVAAEALLRAKRGSGEIRSGEPIAAGAEEGPDLFRFDSWMMQQAYRDAMRWKGVRLHVNLSPREFEEGGSIIRRVRKLGRDLSFLSLEITETRYIDKPKQAVRVFDHLRELGVQLWLDDFGTIHSSISHLLDFRLDGLKIPSTFVKGLPAEKRCRSITKAMITMAHDLGMKVIAEGIEHEKQLAFLREARCDYIQGFLWSQPMALDRFESSLRGFDSSGQ